VLTLRELQRWLALAVAVCGQITRRSLRRRPGGGLDGRVRAPVTVSNAGVPGGLPARGRRTLTRRVRHRPCPVLRRRAQTWIARRDRLDRFVIRRDPRDIQPDLGSGPRGDTYIEVPYRTLSHPPISAWEQKAAVARLRETGRAQVDEQALFRMVEQMRTITERAAATTRKTRRNLERRAGMPTRHQPPPAPPACPADTETATAVPFEVIEEW
jgi:putative transposase